MQLSEQAKGAKKNPKDDKTVAPDFGYITVVIYRTTLKANKSNERALAVRSLNGAGTKAHLSLDLLDYGHKMWIRSRTLVRCYPM